MPAAKGRIDGNSNTATGCLAVSGNNTSETNTVFSWTGPGAYVTKTITTS